MDSVVVASQRDVFGRWLVEIHPMWMRVVDAEKLEAALAEFDHEAREILRRDQIIPNWVGGDVFCGECTRDDIFLSSQEAAAFMMRLEAGMFQDLPEHFTAASNGWGHSEECMRSEWVRQAAEQKRRGQEKTAYS